MVFLPRFPAARGRAMTLSSIEYGIRDVFDAWDGLTRGDQLDDASEGCRIRDRLGGGGQIRRRSGRRPCLLGRSGRGMLCSLGYVSIGGGTIERRLIHIQRLSDHRPKLPLSTPGCVGIKVHRNVVLPGVQKSIMTGHVNTKPRFEDSP